MAVVCKDCGTECSAPNALGYHLRKAHGTTYVEYLVRHEHGGIWPRCKCGSPRKWHNGGFRDFCSRSCAASGEDNAMGRLKGEASPNFGKRRTAEQRARYSAAAKKRWDGDDPRREQMKTQAYRDAQRAAQKEAYATTNRAEKVSQGNRRFWTSSPLAQQRRREASDRAIVLLEQDKIGPCAPFKAKWKHNPFTGKEERMHSSWESAFLDRCVREGYPVTKEHGLRIPYAGGDGNQHQYVPDFVALHEPVVFEVKGLVREDDERKLAALQEWADANGHEVVLVDYLPT